MEADIAGMVLGWGLVTTQPWRLVLYVILFIIGVLVVTIIFQSVGIAPVVGVI